MAATPQQRLSAALELRARGKLTPEMEKQVPGMVMQILGPGERARAQAMLEGRSILTAREKGSPMGQRLMEAANLIDPSYDEAQAASRFKTVKDFADVSPTKPGGNLVAAGAAIQHLNRLSKVASGTAGHEIPVIGTAVNATENALAEWSGKPGITTYKQNAGVLANELTRYYRMAGGNEADIQREIGDFSPNMSQSQKDAAIGGAKALLGARLHELVTQYQAGTSMHRLPPSMSPEAQKVYSDYVASGKDAAAPKAAAPAAPASGPPGKIAVGKDGVREWSPN